MPFFAVVHSSSHHGQQQPSNTTRWFWFFSSSSSGRGSKNTNPKRPESEAKRSRRIRSKAECVVRDHLVIIRIRIARPAQRCHLKFWEIPRGPSPNREDNHKQQQSHHAKESAKASSSSRSSSSSLSSRHDMAYHFLVTRQPWIIIRLYSCGWHKQRRRIHRIITSSSTTGLHLFVGCFTTSQQSRFFMGVSSQSPASRTIPWSLSRPVLFWLLI